MNGKYIGKTAVLLHSFYGIYISVACLLHSSLCWISSNSTVPKELITAYFEQKVIM